ncbi:SubName: Full=Uncharacterized protein {ECO:0000313/EMBL:CCA73059.1} [Serendipita indica DSM 11827]|uniref:Uncharacterized protein n=1 Tax=Serendipita indica (strain DSM 11827) TaxID=1109443 RepID=G4TP16_SERID|nr:SubName: Full=Uncharacterized protein {ECO:0000313/EMBL:CCA73059.1} [Serendipita indica DSM 11827]CCA73059.1 hypothetical protein PIIN_07014 [Serendipita indica DSM 11827]
MSQRPAYDQTLLAGAPSVTREERQAGYDINALESGNYGAPIASGSRPAGTRAYEYPTTTADPFADPYAQERSFTPSITRSTTKKPWWTTKRGRWALGLAAIVFIGLIAGIAAGTAAARNARNRTLLQNNEAAESPQGAQSSSTSRVQALPSSSSTPLTSSSPQTTSNPILQQPNDSTPFVTRTTLVVAPTPDVSVLPPNQGTTITFGAPPAQTPGTSPNIGDEDIPLICYVVPHSSACAPYFENGRRRS